MRKRHKKKNGTLNFKVGDSVVTKPGVHDTDLGCDMSGWQGRVLEIKEHAQYPASLQVGWDSLTLKGLPPAFIETCEVEGMSWSEYYLPLTDAEKTTPRDTEADVKAVIAEIARENAWVYLGEEGKAIQKVLAGVDRADEWACFEAWYGHLDKTLSFPFEAKVVEFQERGPLRAGDRVRVKALSDIAYPYGVLVDIKKGRLAYVFPLCDLEVTNKRIPLHDVVQEYAVWFANR